jgi:hypothetical protein
MKTYSSQFAGLVAVNLSDPSASSPFSCLLAVCPLLPPSAEKQKETKVKKQDSREQLNRLFPEMRREGGKSWKEFAN